MSFFPSQIQSILTETNSNAKASKNVPSQQQSRLNADADSNVAKFMSREDMEMVMENSMGMTYSPDPDNVNQTIATAEGCLGGSEFSALFEEMEPRLDEVKEAFDMFDVYKDGFIDARELQRVLCALGFKEALKLEACERMIGAFDRKGKGRIDLIDFAIIMENSFESSSFVSHNHK